MLFMYCNSQSVSQFKTYDMGKRANYYGNIKTSIEELKQNT